MYKNNKNKNFVLPIKVPQGANNLIQRLNELRDLILIRFIQTETKVNKKKPDIFYVPYIFIIESLETYLIATD
jgi:hypothetical protein